jgi:hypothetical protein
VLGSLMARLRAIGVAFGFTLLLASVAAAQDGLGDICGPGAYRKITAGIRSGTVEPAAVQDWLARFRRADDLEQRGMAKAAIRKDVKAIIEGFRDLPPGVNPFASEREVYRAIGKIVDADPNGASGINAVVGAIFANNDSNEKGGLLVLKVADELGLADKIRNGTASFEKTVTLTVNQRTFSRRSDITVADAAAAAFPHLGGRFEEIKHWVAPLAGPSDSRLVRFAEDQFRQDIVLQAGTDWTLYRLTLKLPPGTDSSIVLAKLLEQFNDPSVREFVDPNVLERMRDVFSHAVRDRIVVFR